ncbi:MAG: transposase, partial [Oligoflexales bacterium]
ERIYRVYDAIVATGLAFHESQPPLSAIVKRGRKKRRTGHNLLLRLLKHKDAVLRFLSSESLPFTNNQAEQDVRMMKVRMKMSGNFRSFQGAKIFSDIRSFTSTCRKQGKQCDRSSRRNFLGPNSRLA